MKSTRFIARAAAAFTALALLASTALGGAITSINDIQYWVGSGTNQAALIIDWNDGQSTQSFAWGYRWNGTASGEDMLRAIAGFVGTNTTPAQPNGTGDAALTLYTQTFSFGQAVYQLDYLSHSKGGFDVDSAGYWSYYVANDTALAPTLWTPSDVGFSDRNLANNSWDGWSWAADFTDTAPKIGIAAVPEPGTFGLIGAGISLLLLWKRRRHA